jgi:hypothetical protein
LCHGLHYLQVVGADEQGRSFDITRNGNCRVDVNLLGFWSKECTVEVLWPHQE